MSESTVVSAECDKLQIFTDTLFGSEAQQITYFHKFVLLARSCALVSHELNRAVKVHSYINNVRWVQTAMACHLQE